MKKEAEIMLEAEEVMGNGLTQSVIDFGLVEQPQESYQPLPSVWDGDDSELLELMLNFYPRSEPKLILDATINRGRFWKGSQRPVIGLDISSHYHPRVVGDNMRMPFRPAAFDVVVYDPPHIPNQGKDRKRLQPQIRSGVKVPEREWL